MRPALLVVSALACLLCGCEPSLTFEAKAGCGEASKEQERHGPEMLPGRECQSCHRGYTASGTVFETLDAACSTGMAGVTVEILDDAGVPTISMTTNAVGNFYTKARLPRPYRARITAPDGRSQQAQHGMDGNCSRCHRQPPVEKAHGRVALDAPPSAAPDAGSAAGAAGGAG